MAKQKKRSKPKGRNKYRENYDRQSKRHFPKYKKYIASPQWKEKRYERLQYDGYRCRLCGATNYLTVHHITYRHLGDEKMRDLITLCQHCHERIHEELKTGDGDTIRKALFILSKDGWEE